MRTLPFSSLLTPIGPRLFALAAAAAALAGTPVHAQCPVTFGATNTSATGQAPTDVATGDFNIDGFLDLILVNSATNNVSIRFGFGNGTFSEMVNFATGAVPQSVAVGDFNADGKLDLAVANDSGNSVSVLLGIINGAFAPAVNYGAASSPVSVAVGDFNGDGRLDLVTANIASNNVAVLLGNGNGTFAPAAYYATGAVPRSVAVSDLNGDGRMDLVTANTGNDNVSVLLANSNGTFLPAVAYGAGDGPLAVAIGDVNGDGNADLAVADGFVNAVSVLLGGGNGTFAPAVAYGTGSVANSVTIGDLNGDGRLDLATTNAEYSFVSVLVGNGNGTFATASNLGTGAGPISLVIGDFNVDGKPDLATVNIIGNSFSVLLNTISGYAPPVFTQQPAGALVQAGTPVSLTSAANFSGGPANYQWRRNGVPLSNGGGISGATTATLTINPASAGDMGVYDVQAISQSCVGSQSVVTSTQAVLAVTAPLTPANDACASARLITNGAYTYSTIGATTEGPQEHNLPWYPGDDLVNNDVWFLYTATCSGTVTVSLCGSNFDTKYAVYAGPACPTGPDTAIAGGDDSGVCPLPVNSYGTFPANAGRQYLIRVGNWIGSEPGEAVMNISCDGSGCLVADMGVQGGISGRDNQLDNNDFIAFIDAFFNHTECP